MASMAPRSEGSGSEAAEQSDAAYSLAKFSEWPIVRQQKVAFAGTAAFAAIIATTGWVGISMVEAGAGAITPKLVLLAATALGGAWSYFCWSRMTKEAVEISEEVTVVDANQIERELTLKRELDQKSANLRDLAKSFDNMISNVVSSVAAASTQLNATASAMADSADTSSDQISSVNRAMEEASQGVTAAAAASDEFAMSIGEISRQASSSAELARKANEAAENANGTISTLSDSAVQIEQIVELIQTIAQRTNLLALNASIEAARGGESGRGFAVVAAEVKELAAQTSKATQDVARQISEMQDSTAASVGALRSIGTQIKQLEATAISIASAVDQQAVAGQDLARSIDRAAHGADDASVNMSKVSGSVATTGESAGQVLASANDLEVQATTLKNHVGKWQDLVKTTNLLG